MFFAIGLVAFVCPSSAGDTGPRPHHCRRCRPWLLPRASSSFPLERARSPKPLVGNAPAVFVLAEGRQFLFDLLDSALHAGLQRRLLLLRSSLSTANGLPASTPILANWARNGFSTSAAPTGGHNCRMKFRYSNGSGVSQFLVELRPLDFRSSRRGGLPQERGERLNLVAGLDLLHVVDIAWVEQLGADRPRGKNRSRSGNTFFTPSGVSPFQFGPAIM